MLTSLRRSARKKKNTQEWWKTSNGGTKRKSNEETETSEKKSKVESCLETISISMNEAENRKSVLTKRNVKKAQKMKQTKAESALRQAIKDLNDLEKKHNEMRRKYEKEIKKLNAKLKSISSSSKQDAGKMHTKNSLAAVFTSSEVNAIKTQFESLTGLCVEPDQKSPHKLQCTVLNRPARKGVKFVISLPDESDPGCQYIPIANCHLLSKHLQCPLEFEVEDAPSVVSEIIGEVFA
jgi:hypothetical protein